MSENHDVTVKKVNKVSIKVLSEYHQILELRAFVKTYVVSGVGNVICNCLGFCVKTFVFYLMC